MTDDHLYDVGDLVELTGTFTDLDGDLADPDDVTLTVRTPEGVTESAVDLSSPSTGVWRGTYLPATPGIYWYRFAGGGIITAAEERAFRVRKQRVPAA